MNLEDSLLGTLDTPLDLKHCDPHVYNLGNDEICCLEKKFESGSGLQHIRLCYCSALYFCTSSVLSGYYKIKEAVESS